MIMGDVNFHLDTICDSDTRRFNEILEAHGLQQHVKEHTYHRGHTLDVVITRSDTSIIRGIHVFDPGLGEGHGRYCVQ